MKSIQYLISDLISFFQETNNYAATEFFHSLRQEGIEICSRSGLDGMFDEQYVRIITANVVGRMSI